MSGNVTVLLSAGPATDIPGRCEGPAVIGVLGSSSVGVGRSVSKVGCCVCWYSSVGIGLVVGLRLMLG